ncbi:MAG: NPCBM/NEW2 domain-containing protein [Verrucomicrobia bacterium]|nr:NPCBM/NEW2 domain-containing protein [Verrucomicrobiota bacterium]
MPLPTRALALFLIALLPALALQAAPPPPVELLKPLTVETAASVKQQHGKAQTDKSYGNGPLTIAGTLYDQGIGTHAPSELVFALDGKRSKFTALVGMDDKGGPTAPAQFKVLLDRQRPPRRPRRLGQGLRR